MVIKFPTLLLFFSFFFQKKKKIRRSNFASSKCFLSRLVLLCRRSSSSIIRNRNKENPFQKGHFSLNFGQNNIRVYFQLPTKSLPAKYFSFLKKKNLSRKGQFLTIKQTRKRKITVSDESSCKVISVRTIIIINNIISLENRAPHLRLKEKQVKQCRSYSRVPNTYNRRPPLPSFFPFFPPLFQNLRCNNTGGYTYTGNLIYPTIFIYISISRLLIASDLDFYQRF